MSGDALLLPDASDLALLLPVLACTLVALGLGIRSARAMASAASLLAVWIAPAILLATLLRVVTAGSLPSWHDEGLTAIRCAGRSVDAIARQTAGGVWLSEFTRFTAPLPNGLAAFLLRPAHHNADVHPPLYFLLGRLWEELAGSGIPSLRVFSVILGLLAVAAAGSLGYDVFESRPAAAGAALAMAVSPLQCLFGSAARMYSLVALLTLVSTAVLLRFLRTGRTAQLVLYGALVGVGCLTHGLFGLLAAGHVAYLLLQWRREPRRSERAAAAAFVGAACALPWLGVAYSLGRGVGIEWLFESENVAWLRRLIAGLGLMLVPLTTANALYGIPAVLALVASVAVGLRHSSGTALLALPAAFYVAVLCGLDLLRDSRFAAQPKYFVAPASLLLVLMGGLVAERASGDRRVFAGAALVLATLAAAAYSFLGDPTPKYTLPGVTARLASAWREASPRARLVISPPAMSAMPELVAFAESTTVPVWVEQWPAPLPPGTFVWHWDPEGDSVIAPPGTRLARIAFHVSRVETSKETQGAP